MSDPSTATKPVNGLKKPVKRKAESKGDDSDSVPVVKKRRVAPKTGLLDMPGLLHVFMTGQQRHMRELKSGKWVLYNSMNSVYLTVLKDLLKTSPTTACFAAISRKHVSDAVTMIQMWVELHKLDLLHDLPRLMLALKAFDTAATFVHTESDDPADKDWMLTQSLAQHVKDVTSCFTERATAWAEARKGGKYAGYLDILGQMISRARKEGNWHGRLVTEVTEIFKSAERVQQATMSQSLYELVRQCPNRDEDCDTSEE